MNEEIKEEQQRENGQLIPEDQGAGVIAPEPKTEPADKAAAPAGPWEIKDVKFEKSGSKRAHYPREPRMPQVAFVGRSNVGKSSLLNVLVNRKRMAHVSRTPGRTQLVNFFIVNDNIRLVDLPGYGFAKAPRAVKNQWDSMISGYLLKNRDLKLVVALFDMRRDPTEEDESLLEWLRHYEIPFMVVLTKADKLTRSAQGQKKKEMAKWLEPWKPRDMVLFSALNRQGRDDVLQAIGEGLAAPPVDKGAAKTSDENGIADDLPAAQIDHLEENAPE